MNETAIQTHGLGKRFGDRWAVQDCTLSIPAGKICGLVGANGAGKSTLIRLLVGLSRPSAGTATIDDRPPDGSEAFLQAIGYLGQDVPLYPRWTAEDHLQMGAAMNARWDATTSVERLRNLDIPLDRRVEHLSGGMRAQVALAVAMAKQPKVLLLDEPVAALDPLARRELLGSLAAAMAERPMTMLLSSHLLADLERICDHLVVMANGRSVLAADVDEIARTHKLVRLPTAAVGAFAQQHEVIQEDHDHGQATVLARLDRPALNPAWQIDDVSLEEIVLGYLGRRHAPPTPRPTAPALEAVQ